MKCNVWMCLRSLCQYSWLFVLMNKFRRIVSWRKTLIELAFIILYIIKYFTYSSNSSKGESTAVEKCPIQFCVCGNSRCRSLDKNVKVIVCHVNVIFKIDLCSQFPQLLFHSVVCWFLCSFNQGKNPSNKQAIRVKQCNAD